MVLKNILQLRKLSPINTVQRCFNKSSLLFGALTDSPNAQLDKNIYDRYMCLPTPECKTQTTYIWIDGSGQNLRNKSRTLEFVPNNYKEVPNWSFDGSSTGQGTPTNSDCYLVPVAIYNDPVRRGNSKLVLCETFNSDEKPSDTNHRQKCVEAINKACDHEVTVGFEQEFVLIGADGRPFGWPSNGEPSPAGPYYSGVGANKVIGREIIESFYRCCLYCGIDMYGVNSEVMLSQWEFQTGPTLSIKAADDLWMARWLLNRVAEDFGVSISFQPKLYPNWHASGMHTNFSTKRMREDNGYKHIEEAVKKLEACHKDHIKVYDAKGGLDNKKRLIGMDQTSSIDKFTWGVADRKASVRISKIVSQKKKGYFEDRRPASNADPYQVINALLRTCTLN